MLHKWLLGICSTAVALVSISANDLNARANAIVENFTDKQIVGQLAQVAISSVLNADYSLNEDLVRYYAKLHVGSFLISPFANGPNDLTGVVGWGLTDWRDIITRIQEIVMEENDGIPMIYGLDSVHGAGFVLNTTLFGAQINSGASFNPNWCTKWVVSPPRTHSQPGFRGCLDPSSRFQVTRCGHAPMKPLVKILISCQ
ncbi:TBC1 domain family member 13 [Phytophthora nicotianae]|uniref:beta-glucosidase n=1 Tax=Phytophthora nicotianae TaxID=4792 RepID=A0A0W8D2Y6_PHYNI|nr:TBC1 domain family member 13 [Phytophthora nicotianae]